MIINKPVQFNSDSEYIQAVLTDEKFPLKGVSAEECRVSDGCVLIQGLPYTESKIQVDMKSKWKTVKSELNEIESQVEWYFYFLHPTNFNRYLIMGTRKKSLT